MNLPISTPIVKDVFLEDLIPDKLFLDLEQKKFSGYTYLTTYGKYSFEESIIIFLKGNIVGSIYLLDKYDIELFGKDSFSLCTNNFGAKLGVLNIYILTEDQIKLILIFNDKIKYDFNINKNKKKLNYDYKEEIIKSILKDKINVETPKKELFNRFKLNELLGI